MKIEQIYTGCLAQAAYYIESEGEAAIFDPLREVQPYLQRAKADQARIKYVFETHFHADFVSGHLDLQKHTGAPIVFGPNANPSYEAIIAEDGQMFSVGAYKVKVIHTPGHTMESTTYLLIDENNQMYGIITGDTLFIGDVGRPDLAQSLEDDLTQEVLAGHLYDSLRTKIMTLPDHLIVFPSHGAGSACGKKMSKETTDTLGNQKRYNYALRENMSRQEFIHEVLDGLTAPPQYFPQNVMMNIKGYESLDKVMERATKALQPIDFEMIANETGALVLDTRNAADFSKGFIPNSINIGLAGSFAPWVGEMIPSVKQEILLVTEPGTEQEAITRLSRVGYDQVLGYLENGFQTWVQAGKDVEIVDRVTATVYEENQQIEHLLIDVRKPTEFEAEHVKGAVNIPLSEINQQLSKFPKDQPFTIHCAGGFRSMIAASILKQRGWHHFQEIEGGFKAIKDSGVETTEFVCPSTQSS